MNPLTPRDGRNFSIFSRWMLAAILTFAVATILIDSDSIPGAAGWALTVATVVLMIVAMRSYVVFLRQADELLRKVHLEALALAFGAGIISMMGYRLCERLGAPKLDVNDASLVMLICWMLVQWHGWRRYSVEEES
ncbi:MAG TPA: hypothetical protein VEO54_28875 [Thermoanaerobaculia bacterium]|nr:hypothetical protein [Thermoanaerobaculia bacterium]